MKSASVRMVFAILIAVVLFAAFVAVIDPNVNYKGERVQIKWLLAGFGVVFVAGFILLYIRFTPVVIVGTLALLGMAYFLWRAGDKGMTLSACAGAIVSIVLLLFFQVGWVKKTGYSDYVKDQQAIFEKGQNYAQQQQARYEQEKDREGKGGPP